MRKEDERIFDFLMDKKKYKMLITQEYDREIVECRKQYLRLLYAVVNDPQWEITEAHIEYLAEKFLIPAKGKLQIIHNYMVENDFEVDEHIWSENKAILQRINRLSEEIAEYTKPKEEQIPKYDKVLKCLENLFRTECTIID